MIADRGFWPKSKNVLKKEEWPYFALAGLAILILIPFFEPSVGGYDDAFYYSLTRSLVFNHDLNLLNELRYFRFTGFAWAKTTTTGMVASPYPIGSSLFWLPALLFAHGVALAAKQVGFAFQTNGYSSLYQMFAAYTTFFFGVAGIMITYKWAREFFGAKISFFSTLVVWTASPLIYYMYQRPLRSEALSMFTVTLFLYVWHKTKDSNRGLDFFLLGLLGGLMILVRWQTILFVVVPLGELIINFAKKRKASILMRTLRNGFSLGIGILLPCTIQLIFWKKVYGSFLLIPQGPTFLGWSSFQLIRALIGPTGWTLVFIVCLAGFYYLFKKSPRIGGLLIISFLLQWYIVGSVTDPFADKPCFGARYLIPCFPIFVLALAALVEVFLKKMSWWPIGPVGLLLVALNLAQMAVYVFIQTSPTVRICASRGIWDELFYIVAHPKMLFWLHPWWRDVSLSLSSRPVAYLSVFVSLIAAAAAFLVVLIPAMEIKLSQLSRASWLKIKWAGVVGGILFIIVLDFLFMVS